jgi:hypothetical protein
VEQSDNIQSNKRLRQIKLFTASYSVFSVPDLFIVQNQLNTMAVPRKYVKGDTTANACITNAFQAPSFAARGEG